MLDAFQDQEVRDAGGELDVGGGFDRAAIQVRCDLGVMGFGHAGDLLAFQDAANPAQRRLQDAGRASLQHAGEFVFGAQALTGGHRNAGVARNLGHHLGALGRGRLLEPQRVVLLEPACHAFGARHRVLAMGAEQYVGLVADRLADEFAEALGQVHALERRLARVEHRITTHRVELDRGESLRHVDGGTFCRLYRVVIEGFVFVLVRIQIGVRTQPRVDQATEQLVDRLLQRLAGDVPAGHLERTEDTHQRHVRAQREAGAIRLAPQGFGLHRILAGEHTLEQVLGHRGDHMRAEGRGISLANAFDAAGGTDLDEHKVLAAKRWWRIADHKGLDRFEFHRVLSPG